MIKNNKDKNCFLTMGIFFIFSTILSIGSYSDEPNSPDESTIYFSINNFKEEQPHSIIKIFEKNNLWRYS